MGLRLALKLAVPMLAFVAAATLALILFIWSGVDVWIALVVILLGLLAFTWYVDRRDKARRAR